MKKLFYMFAAAMLAGGVAQAAPGDTTWVQANVDSLDGYGTYDSTVTFPTPASGVTYRNIYMIFTLGKHECPAGSTWCGDWDYTVLNYLMTPAGDTMELGRFITPYANAGAPRTPFSWTQRYVYDVTDYAAKLQGSATVRILYSGYSGGFTGNIRFAFVEGTPDRTVTGIETLWTGSYGYGGTPDINTHYPALTKVAPAGTVSTDVKFLVTGHGNDASGCCEFLSKNYQVMLNGAPVATQAIWRDNCGSNQLSPQSGTWIYNRGNWCPGAMVYPNFHALPGITAGSSYSVGLQFDAYTGSGGSYTTEATLINYGGMNKAVDAGIEDIIAPTNNENHFRQNPLLGSPMIHVKNRGAAPITNIAFQYGIQDSAMNTYTWTGTLAPLAEMDVTLPLMTNFSTIAGTSGLYTFIAKITAVNGAADNDATNDIMKSQFAAGPQWDPTFKILFRTNNEETSAGSGISETEWKIYNEVGTVVASRTGAAINKLYTDTVNLYTGFYKLEVTDGSCDGLHWWVWDSNPSAGINAGYLNVKKMTNLNIPMNGYQYSGTYANDFGCNFTQYFYVLRDHPAGVNDITATGMNLEVFPNPAQGTVNITIAGIASVNGTIQVIDAMGRLVKSVPCTVAQQSVDLAGITTGVYTIRFVSNAGGQLQSRLMITK